VLRNDGRASSKHGSTIGLLHEANMVIHGLLNPDPVYRPGRADTPILALEKIERAVRRLTWHPAT